MADERLDGSRVACVACMVWYGLGSACGTLAFALEAGVRALVRMEMREEGGAAFG